MAVTKIKFLAQIILSFLSYHESLSLVSILSSVFL